MHEHAWASIAREYYNQLDEWRKKHCHVLRILHKEESRCRTVVAEHRSLSLEIEKFRKNEEGEVKQLELKRAVAISAAELAHQKAIAQLKETYALEVEALNNRHALALGTAKFETRRLRAELARLRAERNERHGV